MRQKKPSLVLMRYPWRNSSSIWQRMCLA